MDQTREDAIAPPPTPVGPSPGPSSPIRMAGQPAHPSLRFDNGGPTDHSGSASHPEHPYNRPELPEPERAVYRTHTDDGAHVIAPVGTYNPLHTPIDAQRRPSVRTIHSDARPVPSPRAMSTHSPLSQEGPYPPAQLATRRESDLANGIPPPGSVPGSFFPLQKAGEQTLEHRLTKTIEAAEKERILCAQKAKWTSWTLNIAIGIQVLLGALTTALSAASPKHIAMTTSVLGGMSTLVASYQARARGSGEPELSTARLKDLEAFLRECRDFETDHGYLLGSTHEEATARLMKLRERLEDLLGNGNGDRKLSRSMASPESKA